MFIPPTVVDRSGHVIPGQRSDRRQRNNHSQSYRPTPTLASQYSYQQPYQQYGQNPLFGRVHYQNAPSYGYSSPAYGYPVPVPMYVNTAPTFVQPQVVPIPVGGPYGQDNGSRFGGTIAIIAAIAFLFLLLPLALL